MHDAINNNDGHNTLPYIRPDTRQFLNMLEQMDGDGMAGMPVTEARATYQMLSTMMDADPPHLAIISDHKCPGPAGPIALRLYDKREYREPGPVILFFHGGGFIIGDLETHHNFCAAYAEAMDLPLIAVDYRLAPEHVFPAAPDDTAAATRWIAENSKAFAREFTGLILTGDSAGGNLAIVTANGLAKKPAALPVLAYAPIYPITSGNDSGGSFNTFHEGFFLTAKDMLWFAQKYDADPQDPRAFPILEKTPNKAPCVIITGSLDPLRDQGRAYATKLIEGGYPVHFMEAEGNIHGFAGLRKIIPSSQDDLKKFFAALRLAIGEKGTYHE